MRRLKTSVKLMNLSELKFLYPELLYNITTITAQPKGVFPIPQCFVRLLQPTSVPSTSVDLQCVYCVKWKPSQKKRLNIVCRPRAQLWHCVHSRARKPGGTKARIKSSPNAAESPAFPLPAAQ